MYPSIWPLLFLRCDVNSTFAKVVGDRVNRGAGYGLEIPCKYSFYGPKPKELVALLEVKGLVSTFQD